MMTKKLHRYDLVLRIIFGALIGVCVSILSVMIRDTVINKQTDSVSVENRIINDSTGSINIYTSDKIIGYYGDIKIIKDGSDGKGIEIILNGHEVGSRNLKED